MQAIEGPFLEMMKEKLAHSHTQQHLLTPRQELSQHLRGPGRWKPVSLLLVVVMGAFCLQAERGKEAGLVALIFEPLPLLFLCP